MNRIYLNRVSSNFSEKFINNKNQVSSVWRFETLEKIKETLK
jgi:hypothetical protein